MAPSPLHIVGVRHHSPACARLVEHVIHAVRPAHVLVEGPSDFNDRMGELLLDHQLPLAVFSFHRGKEHGASCWSPLCDYSPEWRALRVGQEVGAQLRFMDLPAWDKAFLGVRNRYSDGDRKRAAAVEALCQRFHLDGSDALWDHLFEGPLEGDGALDRLGMQLAAYFRALRGVDDPGERDARREATMRAFIQAALSRQEGPVVVVCGGYHAPALQLEVPSAFVDWPHVDIPDGATSHLVPYSYFRLDSFTGYQSGMPSPAYHDLAYREGARAAVPSVQRILVAALRARGLPVSSADLVAAEVMAEGLARLRGHACVMRTDLLDGLAAALVKEALDAPLPWSVRGVVSRQTDPLLLEILKALTGSREGRLHVDTPRPPLRKDVALELEAHALQPASPARTLKLDLAQPEGRARSRVLHRLRVLEIPGFTRQRGPNWATEAQTQETWLLARLDTAESALLEAAGWGPTLEAAAAARLEDALSQDGLDALRATAVLGEAIFIGVDGLTSQALQAVRHHVQRDPLLENVGGALDRLLSAHQHDALFGARGNALLGAAVTETFSRATWLLEHVSGGTSPRDAPLIHAVRAMTLAAASKLALDVPAFRDVLVRRMHDQAAPPAVGGACLGSAWRLGALLGGASEVVQAIKRSSHPTVFGDFLAGLFATAREEFSQGPELMSHVDEVLAHMTEQDFLIALPSLRLAFTYFPPREKAEIARHVAQWHHLKDTSGHGLLRLETTAGDIAAFAAADTKTEELIHRYGLARVGDEP